MAGQITIDKLQVGNSATATQNFVLQTNADGTAKMARGNVGSTTQDVLTINASGLVGAPQGYSDVLGSGQTWQTVTRTSGTTYYNTTGKPIIQNCWFNGVASGYQCYSSMSINGGTAVVFVGASQAASLPLGAGSIVIPSGASYVRTDTNASAVTISELR